MEISKKELVMYGLEGHTKVVDEIIKDLNASEYYFEIKLILVEALTNTFNYGNKGDKSQPIFIRYSRCGTTLAFEIQGIETTSPQIPIPEKISEDNLLNEHGRGLYLINCFADELKRDGGTLYIKKNLEMRG